jgi:hypothetical protein
MLLRFLARRSAPLIAEHHRFRWRGDGVSRIEGLSDAVFGFAITLLVVSLEVPKTADDLMVLAKGFLPFVASFFVLFGVWRLQFSFFRRYGLEDTPTEWLTGALLVMVLFAVYPLKFLFTIVGGLLLTGDGEAIKQHMRIEDLPKVIGLYAFGIFGIFLVFSRLYHHAYTQRGKLSLNALELFDTIGMERRMRRGAVFGATMLAWCGAQLSIPDHMRARDNLFWTVYYTGLIIVLAIGLSQQRLRRSLARERSVLASDPLSIEGPILERDR